ncbi:unnamed protein product, partial [Bubo scandiacus]
MARPPPRPSRAAPEERRSGAEPGGGQGGEPAPPRPSPAPPPCPATRRPDRAEAAPRPPRRGWLPAPRHGTLGRLIFENHL